MKTIALGGNPNVGKSTVFNALTGLRQHTGNWPGKTVVKAEGYFKDFRLVDLPGCYSLSSRIAEEEVARDFIVSGEADATIIVCDATCLERGLCLVLQTIAITPNVVVCVNLMDEAEKKKIRIDLKGISDKLGVPVVGTSARGNKVFAVHYPQKHQNAFRRSGGFIPMGCNINKKGLYELMGAVDGVINNSPTPIEINENVVHMAEEICRDTVIFEREDYLKKDEKIDKVLMGKWTAFPIMFLALFGVFWITISGADYPSELIADCLFWIEDRLIDLFKWVDVPPIIYEPIVLGVYRSLAWVVSVMLPPMAIFFPLFALLEDSGFLPRIAFNLDKVFKRCAACGKQALTMGIFSKIGIFLSLLETIQVIVDL